MKALGLYYQFKCGVYKIVCRINHKVYIGSSSNLHKRILEHIRLLRLKKHHCRYLQNCFTKYTENNFVISLICECSVKEVKQLEEKYIALYSKKKLLLNSTLDYRGSRGMPKSKETRNKISKANKGKTPYNKGKAMTLAQRKLLHEVNIRKRGKLVDVYSFNNEFIETILGINTACWKYKVDKRCMQRCLQGERSTAKGFIFRYHQ